MLRNAMHSDSANAFCEVWVDGPILDVYQDFGDLTYDAFLHGAQSTRIDGSAADGSSEKQLETSDASVSTAVRRILGSNLRPLIFGGDHAITYPVIAALRAWRMQTEAAPSFHIVHFDAHPDLYDNFEGNRHSHACPFARICELNIFGGGEVGRRDSSVPADAPPCHISLQQLGIRTHTAHSREQAERFGVRTVEMHEWPESRQSLSSTLSSALAPEEAAAAAVDVYVSFDLDVLDPSCAPGVSHHEPGGLTTRQAVDALHALAALQAEGRINVIGADVVELNPPRDVNGVTGMTAAKIAKELMGLMHAGATMTAAAAR